MWPFKNKLIKWTVTSRDVHLNPTSPEISFIVSDGWEPFSVTDIPNTLDQNQKRVWIRRATFRIWHRKDYEIRIQQWGWGGHEVFLHLEDGWEPFGVSDSFGNHMIWFRKNV